MCVVRRMFGAQVCSVAGWLFRCGLVGLSVVLIVPSFLSFSATPGLCCFLRVTPYGYKAMYGHQCVMTHHIHANANVSSLLAISM